MSATNNRNSSNSTTGGLFAAYLSQDVKKTQSSLFPAYITGDHVEPQMETGQNDKVSNNDSLNWLENKSFGKDTAEILSRIQKNEVAQHISSSEDEISVDDSKSTKRKERERNEDKSEEDGKKSHKKKKKKKHKKKHKRKCEENEDMKEDLHAEQEKFFQSEKGKIFLDDMPGLTAGHAFRVDRSSDSNNWTYGSLYKLHVAKYFKNVSSCLGLGEENWFMSKKARKKSLPHSERYYNKENRKNLRMASEHCQQKNVERKDYEFVPLDAGEEHELYQVLDGSGQVNPLGIYDKSTCSYLQGKSTGKMTEQMNTEVASSNQHGTALGNKTVFFNKQLRDNPNDTNLWLEFVKFQDINSTLTDSNGTEIGDIKNTSTKVTEKKLSILRKAIELNPASVDLKIAQLELAREVSEPSEINSQWSRLLFLHPANVKLWLRYILFVQSNLNQFTVSKTVKCYQTCLSKLLMTMSETVHLIDPDRPEEEDLLMILYQYCSFLHQTSQTEKAVATLQAFVEFNVFSPKLVEGIPNSEKLAIFESFWDSGVARFGEDGAEGWSEWLQSKGANNPQQATEGEVDELEDVIVAKDQPLWKTWIELENYRQSIHWLPWRPGVDQSEEDCEDPDRLVLVDDVASCLFTFSNKELFFDLVILFLHFLGIDVGRYYNSKLSDSIHKSQIFLQTLADIDHCKWDLGFYDDKPSFSENRTKFIRNIFKKSQTLFSGIQQTTINLLTLDFEAKLLQSNPESKIGQSKGKEMKKLSKAMLKIEENRNNLYLWHRHALLETHLGKADECLKVLETVLSMQPGLCVNETSLLTDDTVGLYQLYLTYVHTLLGFDQNGLEFTLGKKKSAPSSKTVAVVAETLECLADGKTFNKKRTDSRLPSATSILKTIRKFEDIEKIFVQKMLLAQNMSILSKIILSLFVFHVSATALYLYTTSGLPSASKHFQSAMKGCHSSIKDSAECSSWSSVKRELYKSWLELVIFNQTVTVCPLSTLQSALDSALKDFPEDKEFLRLFVKVETQSFITGRLRRYFDRTVKSSDTPFPAIYWSLAEIQRQLTILKTKTDGDVIAVRGETGIVHRLRAVFERSLVMLHTQHCVLIWSLYIHCEMTYGDPARAKGLFYRALQKCPWSKRLYMEAVSLFPEQLQELVDLMMEKEIRVQVPVEEIHILRGEEKTTERQHGELYTKLISGEQDNE